MERQRENPLSPARRSARRKRTSPHLAGGRTCPVVRKGDEERAVQTDLPKALPILREEVALLRAYLADEINALLFDEE